jgi:APA family basic amino acid/polyamine antiporter
MSANLFARKSVQDLQHELETGPQLKKVLGPVGLIALGIGGIIGAGIFVLTGQAAAQYAGPSIALSFIISAIACALAGLCYAEFAASIPVSGSAYTYSYATLGEFLAWFIGWDLILEYLFGAAAVAVGWSGYVTSFLKDLGLYIPKELASAPLDHTANGWVLTGSILNLPAMAIVLLCSLFLIKGIQESSSLNNIVVAIKLVVLLLLIGFGVAYINQANWQPFIPPNTGKFGEYGISGILRGAAVVFFAYIGFDAVSTAAQEAKNPQRDMPIGIIGSLVISTVIYIIVALVITGIVPYKNLNVPDPIAVAINATGNALMWLRPIIKIGAIAGLSSVILVSLLGQTRVFFSMSKDGLLPPMFSALHPRFRTPHVATYVTGGATLLVAGLFPISLLGELVSIGTLLAFAIVCASIIVLRKTQPDMPRPFKTPMVPLIPILGVLASLAQMAFLPLDTWLRLIIWMAIGMAVYFGYGIKHSKVQRKAAHTD